MSKVYPKFFYAPDWCGDCDETPVMFAFSNPDKSVLVGLLEGVGEVLYHDVKNCNCMPEFIIKFSDEEGLKKFQEMLFPGLPFVCDDEAHQITFEVHFSEEKISSIRWIDSIDLYDETVTKDGTHKLTEMKWS